MMRSAPGVMLRILLAMWAFSETVALSSRLFMWRNFLRRLRRRFSSFPRSLIPTRSTPHLLDMLGKPPTGAYFREPAGLGKLLYLTGGKGDVNVSSAIPFDIGEAVEVQLFNGAEANFARFSGEIRHLRRLSASGDPWRTNGWVAEWTKALVLKTSVPKGTGGSNPSPSAYRSPAKKQKRR